MGKANHLRNVCGLGNHSQFSRISIVCTRADITQCRRAINRSQRGDAKSEHTPCDSVANDHRLQDFSHQLDLHEQPDDNLTAMDN